MLILKHARNWSFKTLEQEVRVNLVYREFTRIGTEKLPDAKVIAKIARVLGPSVMEELHRRIVELAPENKLVSPDERCVSTPQWWESRMSSKGWCIQRESTPSGQESEAL